MEEAGLTGTIEASELAHTKFLSGFRYITTSEIGSSYTFRIQERVQYGDVNKDFFIDDTKRMTWAGRHGSETVEKRRVYRP